MTPEAWLGLATILALGATSPGPSLAYVLRNTIAGGRTAGLASALGHGLGMGCYAFLFAFSLSATLQAMPTIETPLRMVGAAVLFAIGVMFLRAGLSPNESSLIETELVNAEDGDSETEGMVSRYRQSEAMLDSRRAFAAGFVLAFSNPKIAAFLLALFSQFVEAGATLVTSLAMGALALIIDAGWYAIVAVALGGRIGDRLAAHAARIDIGIGILMLGFGGAMLLF